MSHIQVYSWPSGDAVGLSRGACESSRAVGELGFLLFSSLLSQVWALGVDLETVL